MSCSGVVALAIGASTVGCAASHANATAATVAPCAAATRSRASSTAKPRSFMYRSRTPPARGLLTSGAPGRYFPVEEAACEAEVGQAGQALLGADARQLALVVPLHQVVVRLQRDVARHLRPPADLERLASLSAL